MTKQAVAYCVSGTHIQLTAISIASLVKNYESDKKLDIVIVADNILSQDIDRIRQIPSHYQKAQIAIYVWHPPTIVQKIHSYSNKRFPEVTLWRLFLPSYFPMYEKIMYFDNDTLIYGDISNLFQEVTEFNLIGAVRDFYFYIFSEKVDQAEQFGVATMTNYVNSGFIIFNVANFNKFINPEWIIEQINLNQYQYLDQTLLNILCEDKIDFLPFSYNYQKDDHWLNDWAKHFSSEAARKIEKARDQIVVRHFVEFGEHSMPWEHFSVLDKWERDFWKYLCEVKMFDAESRL